MRKCEILNEHFVAFIQSGFSCWSYDIRHSRHGVHSDVQAALAVLLSHYMRRLFSLVRLTRSRS